jgi:hypothetical protein
LYKPEQALKVSILAGKQAMSDFPQVQFFFFTTSFDKPTSPQDGKFENTKIIN